eukprot:70872-Rhodomonas_salina.1
MVGTVHWQFKKSFGSPAPGAKTDCMRGSFGPILKGKGRIPQPIHHQYECTATISENLKRGQKFVRICSFQNQGAHLRTLFLPETFSFVGA